MDLHIGLVGEKEMIATESDLASFAGIIGADALSTHCVVLLIELAAREAIKGRLKEGKITLGTRLRRGSRFCLCVTVFISVNRESIYLRYWDFSASGSFCIAKLSCAS